MNLAGPRLWKDFCAFWQVFSIEAVWMTSLFVAIGGGTFIIIALNMTIVSMYKPVRYN
jgi:hypothetical protein